MQLTIHNACITNFCIILFKSSNQGTCYHSTVFSCIRTNVVLICLTLVYMSSPPTVSFSKLQGQVLCKLKVFSVT